MKINHRRAFRRGTTTRGAVVAHRLNEPTLPSSAGEPARAAPAVRKTPSAHASTSNRPGNGPSHHVKRRAVHKLSWGELSALERAVETDGLSHETGHARRSNNRRTDHARTPVPSAFRPSTNTLGLPWRMDGPVPVRVWTPHLESEAASQAMAFARLPIVHPNGLALMPDVHPGAQVPVGLVLPTRAALVPRSVGTDIGCGMAAVRLDLAAHQLPDNLRALRLAIEERVPVGAAYHAAAPKSALWAQWSKRLDALDDKCPGLFARGSSRKAHHLSARQLGTLGGGNHFIEVCLDEDRRVWLMVHSGSRGLGTAIGTWFIHQAQLWCEREGRALPSRGLGYLQVGDPLFDRYEEALAIAQAFAAENRRLMMEAALDALVATLGKPVRVTDEAVRCHHNYVAKEVHNGEEVYITRKGAIRAGAGELGIIPGSMGAQSFIVRGKGNAQSWCSCAHGAGRKMSRSQASERFTAADVRAQTRGVECRKDRSVVDEIPGAYKNIHDVMAHQSDLVEVVHTLKQVVCIKG